MTDNNQPFDPPLSAEERTVLDQFAWRWLHAMVSTDTHNELMPNEWASDAYGIAAAAIRERRRFGVPEKPPTVPVEIDTLRTDVESLTLLLATRGETIDSLVAEVARLTKERDEAKNRANNEVENANRWIEDFEKARARAEKAEAELAAARPVLEAVARFHGSPTEQWSTTDDDDLEVMQDYAQRAKRAGGGA